MPSFRNLLCEYYFPSFLRASICKYIYSCRHVCINTNIHTDTHPTSLGSLQRKQIFLCSWLSISAIVIKKQTVFPGLNGHFPSFKKISFLNNKKKLIIFNREKQGSPSRWVQNTEEMGYDCIGNWKILNWLSRCSSVLLTWESHFCLGKNNIENFSLYVK